MSTVDGVLPKGYYYYHGYANSEPSDERLTSIRAIISSIESWKKEITKEDYFDPYRMLTCELIKFNDKFNSAQVNRLDEVMKRKFIGDTVFCEETREVLADVLSCLKLEDLNEINNHQRICNLFKSHPFLEKVFQFARTYEQKKVHQIKTKEKMQEALEALFKVGDFFKALKLAYSDFSPEVSGPEPFRAFYDQCLGLNELDAAMQVAMHCLKESRYESYLKALRLIREKPDSDAMDLAKKVISNGRMFLEVGGKPIVGPGFYALRYLVDEEIEFGNFKKAIDIALENSNQVVKDELINEVVRNELLWEISIEAADADDIKISLEAAQLISEDSLFRLNLFKKLISEPISRKEFFEAIDIALENSDKEIRNELLCEVSIEAADADVDEMKASLEAARLISMDSEFKLKALKYQVEKLASMERIEEALSVTNEIKFLDLEKKYLLRELSHLYNVISKSAVNANKLTTARRVAFHICEISKLDQVCYKNLIEALEFLINDILRVDLSFSGSKQFVKEGFDEAFEIVDELEGIGFPADSLYHCIFNNALAHRDLYTALMAAEGIKDVSMKIEDLKLLVKEYVEENYFLKAGNILSKIVSLDFSLSQKKKAC